LVLIAVAMVVVVARQHPLALAALLSLVLLRKPLQALRTGATGRDLVPVLAATGLFEVGYAVLLAVGLAVS
jgi:1,4-dihydroxy-2-naphthoate octaprenyltransferase